MRNLKKLTWIVTTVVLSCSLPEEQLNEVEFKANKLVKETSTSRSSSSTTHMITNGMTFSQLNSVLGSASSGDTVEVEPGTYQIEGKLNFRSGVSIRKKTSEAPIFDAQSFSPNEMLIQYISSNNDSIDVFGIQFRNIRLKFVNAEYTKFRYCIFDYGIRKSGTDKGFTGDAYIQLNSCSNMQVRGCVFKRRAGNSGRGVYLVNNINSNISNNTFGNGADTGYFVTAINDNSIGTTITGNVIERNESWVNTSETDHGIYAHSFDGLSITNNTISGWPADASGGAIKARNGQNLTISGNTMNTSGVLLYVYSNNEQHPFLKNVVVENNVINVSSDDDDIYHGIGYWRNTSDTDFYEYSIKLDNNKLPYGRIKIGTPVVASDFNANGGGVYDNDISSMTLPTGIANSGNY